MWCPLVLAKLKSPAKAGAMLDAGVACEPSVAKLAVVREISCDHSIPIYTQTILTHWFYRASFPEPSQRVPEKSYGPKKLQYRASPIVPRV